MPRSLTEIIEHADELADRFEDYEPRDADRVPLAELIERRLRQAAVARADVERQVVAAVTAARAEGMSWARIGELLGTSAQATHKRYSAVISRAETATKRAKRSTRRVGPTAVK
jgi:hypothetical protein